MQSYNLFLDTAIETGEGPRLLHELGSNLDEAFRILSLPPTKMAVELAKRAQKPGRWSPATHRSHGRSLFG